MKKVTMLIAAIVSVAAFGDDMTEACAGNAPSNTEYWNNPKDYADDFCALWMHERSKALRQLSQSVKTNRKLNNANRWYFNPKNHPNAEPIQLRRPWMEGLQVKFIDKDTFGKLFCDGGYPKCIEIQKGPSYQGRSYEGLYVFFRQNNWDDGHPLFVDDDGENGYHRFTLNRTFQNAGEAKVCVEAILDRTEHWHYKHPSIESACGGTIECSIHDDKWINCSIE